MRRRLFMAGLASASARPQPAQAQPAQEVPLIGFLHPGFPELGSPAFGALGDGLRELGYVEGKNVRIEARWALGKPEALSRLTRELLQLRVAVLVATARPSIEAAKAATAKVPIVANDLESDPVASGYVASLARPGGNLTGFFLDAPAMCSKWLQQIEELVPDARKIGVLWDSTTGAYQLDAMRAAAKAASVDMSVMEFRDIAGLDAALDLGLKQAPQAVVQLGSPLSRQAGSRIAAILLRYRTPGISPFRSFPDGGGLISYGPNLHDLYRRLGTYVAKVLRGAPPSELPVERPSKFELILNLKAAKALKVKIPGRLLSAADEVIE